MPQRLITFVVRGKYAFPFDMLRYDQAWPTSAGASALDRLVRGENRVAVEGGDGVHRLEPVDVELQTYGNGVTDDRWHSFGWNVVASRKGY